LVEIEGYFSLEFVNYVCETEDRRRIPRGGIFASVVRNNDVKKCANPTEAEF
jgi:hypothetical protein